jgi:hypothetical protein
VLLLLLLLKKAVDKLEAEVPLPQRTPNLNASKTATYRAQTESGTDVS